MIKCLLYPAAHCPHYIEAGFLCNLKKTAQDEEVCVWEGQLHAHEQRNNIISGFACTWHLSVHETE